MKARRVVVAAVVAALALPGAAIAASAGSSPSEPQLTTGPAPGSPAYVQRDAANIEAAFGRELGPNGQLRDPAYLTALINGAGQTELAQALGQASRPTHPAITLGNVVPEGVGDPRRDGWSGTRGRIVPVEFEARDEALLQGDVFAPLAHARDPYTHRALRAPYPVVVIVTGSIQASAGVYAWLAEDLAERGYVVLTFDVQGQGRSETLPHNGTLDGVPSEQQSNFDNDTEDAITWMLSAHNPLRKLEDPKLLAVIGHSTGAVTVSYLQGVDKRITTAVALDKITATAAAISDDQAELGSLPGPVVPRVPILGLQADYGFEPQPYFLANCSSFEPCAGSPEDAPNPAREEQTGFDTWRAKGVDSMVIVPRASTHLDFTDVPLILPASAYGQAMASYYVQAWLDKYLEHDPHADAALLATTLHYLLPGNNDTRRMITIDRDSGLSFYFCSGYAFHLTDGRRVSNGDITHDGCH